MFTTVLFRPALEGTAVEAGLDRLRDSFTVTEGPALLDWVRREWTVEAGRRSFDVAIYNAVPEYGITDAVHIDASPVDLRGAPPNVLTRHGVDYYNIVYTLITELGPVFGLGDFDERFEPRHIPSRWQYRDGRFEEPFWLTVFGEGYTDRFGRHVLLDAPVWHATVAGDCVIALVTRSPFLAAEEHDSRGESEREFMSYLDERVSD